MIATRDFTCTYDGRSEQIKAGITRCSPDHAIVREHPDAFKSEPGDSGLEGRAYLGRGLAVDERSGLTTTERAAMLRRVAELDANAHRRETRRYESPERARDRQFWESSEALLHSLEPRQEHDPLFEDIGEPIGKQDQQLLAEIDAMWN